MNKKLIAAAVTGVFVAPVAMAQTANPVTLYGRVFLMATSVEGKAGGGSAAIPRRTRIDDQSSLLGVRGTEDLGGGLKAFFQLETGFKADQNDTAFAQRNSGVGLQGAWGSILMGRWDTPYKVSAYPVDAFGDLTMAAISGVGHDQGNFDRRDQNMIQYWSPTWAGINFKLMYQVNEQKTATSDPHDKGANISYTGGPLYVFYAYEEHKDPSTTVKKENGNSIGGAFTFGPIKLGAEYEEIKRTAAASGGFDKRKSWLGNVQWTLANNVLIYQHQDSKGGAATSATVQQPSCKSDTLAWKYNFSRRTYSMAQYMKVDNNDQATCSFGTTAPFPVSKGNDVNAFAIGIQHVF